MKIKRPENYKQFSKWTVLFLSLCALTIWTGLVLQFYVTTQILGNGSLTSYFKYISFFTILGNLLAAMSLSTLWIPLDIALCRFFNRTGVKSAVTVYIIVVAVTYSLLLRHLWHPEGIQYVADTLLHDISPVLYVICWFFFVPKGTLYWKSAFIWLVFPLIYFSYILTRGALFQVYPYPFLDVGQIGYSGVLINAIALFGVFIVLGLVVVFIDKNFAPKKTGKSHEH
jgi:hypothetical protein